MRFPNKHEIQYVAELLFSAVVIMIVRIVSQTHSITLLYYSLEPCATDYCFNHLACVAKGNDNDFTMQHLILIVNRSCSWCAQCAYTLLLYILTIMCFRL